MGKQLDLLRAYAIVNESTGGHSATYKQVTDVVKMHESTAQLVTPFFVEIGLLTKMGQQGFNPSVDTLAFQAAYVWNAETAAAKLGPVMAKTWFSAPIITELTFNGSMPLEAAVTKLAEIAHGQPADRRKLVTIIDLMAAVGLLIRDGGLLRRAATTPAMGVEQSAPPAPQPVQQERESVDRQAPMVVTGLHSAAGAVRFNVQVNVDLAEFSGWSPDRITAFFGGIAQVLNAKAAVEQNASQHTQ